MDAPFFTVMAKILDTISSAIARLTGWAVVALATALVLSLLISIFFRYVVGQALSWPEEIALILFAWLILLSGSLGVREGFHVRLTIFTSRLPGPLQKLVDRLVTIVIGLFGLILVYSGWDLVVRTAQHLTPTLRLPLDWLNYSAPVCGALIAIHCLSSLFAPGEEK